MSEGTQEHLPVLARGKQWASALLYMIADMRGREKEGLGNIAINNKICPEWKPSTV